MLRTCITIKPNAPRVTAFDGNRTRTDLRPN
jgi:hypothetical protein